MSIVFTVIVTIVVFMLIIMIHEFGHFIAAKAVGVTVHEFAIGFGPTIWKKQGKETLYSLRIFPIGGFCSLEGEDEESNDPGALSSKPAWKRFIVMAAGAAFNLVTGFIVFVCLVASVPQYPTNTVGGISAAVQNAPAAGILQAGDEITAFIGKRIWYYKDLSFLMSTEADGNPVRLTVKREGVKQEVSVTPVKYQGRYVLGIDFQTVQMNLGNALKYGVAETFFMIRLVIYSLLMLITGKVPITEMAGPVGAGTMIGAAAKESLPDLFNIFALLSVNIGIFNLIPFPALDGGRIFFLLIEMIRRKPIPPEKEGMIHFAGLVLLMLLMVFITSSDIYKLFLPKG